MNKIEKIKKDLEKKLGYNFNNWGKGDLQMLKEIVEATEKVVKNLALSGVVKSFTAKEVANELKDCETIDDAISYFEDMY